MWIDLSSANNPGARYVAAREVVFEARTIVSDNPRGSRMELAAKIYVGPSQVVYLHGEHAEELRRQIQAMACNPLHTRGEIRIAA